MNARTPLRRDARIPPVRPCGSEVRIHIARLVLHGMAHADAGRVARALEAELSRLAAQPGQAFTSASVPHTPLAHFETAEGPERLGEAAATALWSGVRQTGSSRS